jgi:hypothetical protein
VIDDIIEGFEDAVRQPVASTLMFVVNDFGARVQSHHKIRATWDEAIA